jgi:hypothetical protein
MTQKPPSASNSIVVCLFCGTHTAVPFSHSRDSASRPDSGVGVTLVRCQVCRKEAPYSASDIFAPQEVPVGDNNSRTRAAGL